MAKQNTPKWLTLFVVIATILGGCGPSLAESGDSKVSVPDSQAASAVSSSNTAAIPGGEYTKKDLNTEWVEADCTAIALSGDTAVSSGQGVLINEGTVTITQAGDYLLFGSLTGQIIVDAGKNDDVRLILNGVSITSPDSAAIWVRQADKVILTLAAGSENQLADAASRAQASSAHEDVPNAALYSSDDLSINGSGSLAVTGLYDHGILTKNDLVIAGGEISVTAAGDGLKGKDSVAVCGGNISIDAAGDGIQSSETDDPADGWVRIDGGILSVNAGQDGIQAETVLYLADGEVHLTTGGSSHGDGVKADSQTEDFGRGFDGTGGHMGNRDSLQKGKGGQGPDPEHPDGGSPGQMEGEGLQPPAGENFSPPERPDMISGETSGEAPQPPETAPGFSQEFPSALPGGDSQTGDAATVSAKGLKAGTLLQIDGGTVTADCYDDTIHCDGDVIIGGGTLTLSSGDDGIHADNALTVSGGEITVTRSYEGLEGQTLIIDGGVIYATATDDGLNAAGGSDGSSLGGRLGQNSFSGGNALIAISGGEITLDASGDGIDSNGALDISGGIVLISSPAGNGNGALDCDGSFTLTGGILLAAGSAGMAEAPRDPEQPTLKLTFSGNQAARTPLALTDEKGRILCIFTASKSYQSLVLSLPQLEAGAAYCLLTGGTVSGQPAAGAGDTFFYQEADYQDGVQVQTFTLTQGLNSISVPQ